MDTVFFFENYKKEKKVKGHALYCHYIYSSSYTVSSEINACKSLKAQKNVSLIYTILIDFAIEL